MCNRSTKNCDMKKFAAFKYCLAACAALYVLAGCASSPRTEAQWIDPSLNGQTNFLRGEKVLIACDAFDSTLVRICQDELFNEVQKSGAIPVAVPEGTVLLNDRGLDVQLFATAKSLGAKGVFTMTLTPATTNVGPGASLGIGGSSFGGGGGVGIGLGLPIGGRGDATGFAANGRVSDALSSRLLWTATVVAAPTSNINVQFSELSRSVVELARKAGLF